MKRRGSARRAGRQVLGEMFSAYLAVASWPSRAGRRELADRPGKKKPGYDPSLLMWWRRGELNPRPQALQLEIYMLSALF